MSSGLVINGQRVPLTGLNATNWFDNPALRLGAEDMRPRSKTEGWVRLIVLHTTKGIPGGSDLRPQVIRPGRGPSGDVASRLVRFWTSEERGAGAHLVVDFDGSVFCCADLATEAAYHAGHANGVSIGIEIVQGRFAEMYEDQLAAVVTLCDRITALFGIQRQIPFRYLGPVPRLMESVVDAVGVVGHRDLTNRRGPGDPGSTVINRLGLAGYEPVDYSLGQDRELWRPRQRTLGIEPADGIPGPATCRALQVTGKPHGLWVSRPGDDRVTPLGPPRVA